MNNLIFNNNQERNVPIANHHNDFRGFLQHFKNMFDFGHHNDLVNMEPKIEIAENKNNVTVTAEIPGVAEDVTDIILNIKALPLKLESDTPRKMKLKVRKSLKNFKDNRKWWMLMPAWRPKAFKIELILVTTKLILQMMTVLRQQVLPA